MSGFTLCLIPKTEKVKSCFEYLSKRGLIQDRDSYFELHLPIGADSELFEEFLSGITLTKKGSGIIKSLGPEDKFACLYVEDVDCDEFEKRSVIAYMSM